MLKLKPISSVGHTNMSETHLSFYFGVGDLTDSLMSLSSLSIRFRETTQNVLRGSGSSLTNLYPANLVRFWFSGVSENASIVDMSERERDPSLRLGYTLLMMPLTSALQTLPKLWLANFPSNCLYFYLLLHCFIYLSDSQMFSRPTIIFLDFG